MTGVRADGTRRVPHGGGIRGPSIIPSCRPLIRNNIIVSNTAELEGGGIDNCDGVIIGNIIIGNIAGESGGGLSLCGGLIQDNRIEGNSAGESGAGIRWSGGTVQGNTILMNRAPSGGGLANCSGIIVNNRIIGNRAEDLNGSGLIGCNGTIVGNTISGNQAAVEGGGLSRCEAVIENNFIYGNTAREGGGLGTCLSGRIQGNLICGNSAGMRGGGVYNCDIPILNNTIVRNSAETGGGLYLCGGMIGNCVIWDNMASEGWQLSGTSDPFYCCIENWTEGGEGTMSSLPLFFDSNGRDEDPDTYADNDYRFSALSPCVDAGDNSVLDRPGLDLDGNLRIAYGTRSPTVDMGAYEYSSVSLKIGEIMPAIVWIDTGPRTGIRLVWDSQPGDICAIHTCDDLSTDTGTFRVPVSSQGKETLWVDAENLGQNRFYKLGIHR